MTHGLPGGSLLSLKPVESDAGLAAHPKSLRGDMAADEELVGESSAASVSRRNPRVESRLAGRERVRGGGVSSSVDSRECVTSGRSEPHMDASVSRAEKAEADDVLL